MRESAVWEGIYKEWRRGESKFRSLWSISGKEKAIGEYYRGNFVKCVPWTRVRAGD